jgi:diguanylate cyclase (GGDEF)-like protein
VTHPIERADGARAKSDERDALTQTLPRPALMAYLAERLARAERDAEPFGVCLVDLDRFKNINLSHGPSRGDAVLCDVAARLVRTTSKMTGDAGATPPVIARYDGNAFALVVETLSRRQLAATAEALRAAIMSPRVGDTASLSASVGAALTRIGESADSLLLRAEQALFLAKQSGRDRVEVAAGPEPKRAEPIVLSLRNRA